MAIDPSIARGIESPINNYLGGLQAGQQVVQQRNQNALAQRRVALDERQTNALIADREGKAAQEADAQEAAMIWDRASQGDVSALDYAVQKAAAKHPEFAQLAQRDPEMAKKAIYAGLEREFGKKPQAAGALYKVAGPNGGVYQPAEAAAGMPVYEAPRSEPQGPDAPADQRLYEWFSKLPPDKQKAFMDMKRSSATPQSAEDIAAAKARGTVIGKASGTAQTDLPQSTINANSTLNTLDQLEKHEGTRFLFGGYSMAPIVPGTPQADAGALYDQILGKAFLEAFESLKGGGHITEIEGVKATAAITRLQSRRQSYGSAKKAIQELKDIARKGLERQRRQAQPPAPSGSAPKQGSAPPAALEFLKQNPDQIGAFEQKYGYRPDGF
jgi:hypothetical protein